MRLSHWPQLLGHPYALLLYTVTFWSGNMVIGRAFRDTIPPIQLATARYNAAVAKVGAGAGSLFLYAMPVLTALLSLLLLGEAPHLYHLVGLVLVFAGIVVTLRRS